MSAILLSLATFFSTLIGGLFGLRFRDHLNLIMGFTAGVLVDKSSHSKEFLYAMGCCSIRVFRLRR